MPDPNQVQTLTTAEFAFDDTVFTVDCTNPNEPRFPLVEVCAFLGYKSANRASEKIPDKDKSYAVVPTSSGPQRLRMINEPGLYRLVFGSKLPKAQELKRKVFREILPSIRKTGEYRTEKRKLQLAKGQLVDFCTVVQRDLLTVTSREQIAIIRAQMKDFEAATGIEQLNLTQLIDLREEALDQMDRETETKRSAAKSLRSAI